MPSPKPENRIRYHRRWTMQQKARILNEVQDARESGEFGAITKVLRRYNITTSFVTEWKKDLQRHGLWDEEGHRPKKGE